MREQLFERYQLLQRYVGWTAEDAERLRASGPALLSTFPALVEDFYDTIGRHAETSRVLSGGPEQQERLKRSLRGWLAELVAGIYDADYVERRWKVGLRHVEIGLDQVFTNAALSRLRRQLATIVENQFEPGAARAIQHSLDLVIDLDLAVIQVAYQTEFSRLQQAIERAERMAETERVQEALAQSKQALQAVLQAAPCMVIILNAAGLVRYFSPYAVQLTGYQAHEVLGIDYLSLFIHDETMRLAIRRDIERTMAGHPTIGYTNPIRDKSGLTHWMVWNTQPIADYQGEPA
ncbi:MAG: protoglobin domain-containing protein, partial [Planctomycetota bacterium]|nr:protoglobin domain-containing protein [Planctomycetota bacterium]